jgi:hypothetical protein
MLFSAAMSQERTKVVKTNPLGLAFGNFNVTYEKVLNSKSSVLFHAQYMFELLGVDVNTGGLGVGYRYYFTHENKEVPSGFYVQPQTSFGFGSVEDDANFTTVSLGAELGYQWAWPSGFTLDLGIGPNYTVISGDVDDVDFDTTSGIIPSATLAIGFAF